MHPGGGRLLSPELPTDIPNPDADAPRPSDEGDTVPPSEPSRPDDSPPASVREQAGRTRLAALRLLTAHVDLAKAELALIADRAKVAVGLLVLAFALVVFGATLVGIGTPLFLGEWIFGSLGWGVLHGFLLGVAVAVAAVMLALDIPPRSVVATLGAAVVVGVIVGVVLFLNLPNAGWKALGDWVSQNTTIALDAGSRPLVIAVVVVGVIGALVGLGAGWRAGHAASSAFLGFVGGAIIGIGFGAFTAITFSTQVAAAIGVTVALVLWPVLVARPVLSGRYDWEALKARYWPGVTVETAQETYDLVRARMPEAPSRPTGRNRT